MVKITENVLSVCMILCNLLPKASVNDLDSSPKEKFLKVKMCPLTEQFILIRLYQF